MHPSSEARWARSPGTLWRYAGDTVLLLPEGCGTTALAASGSAVLIWELLTDAITLSELASQLAEICNEDPETIASDLAPVLAELHAAAAVQRTR